MGVNMDTDFADSLKNSPVGRVAHDAWLFCLAAGLVAIVAGAVVLVWPGRTLVVLGVVFGIYLIVSGIVGIVLGFAPHLPGGTRFLSVITGILSIVLGVLCLRDELQSVLMLAVWIGAGWIISGVSRVITGLSSSLPGRGWSVALGLVLLLGGIALIVYPADSIAALALISGIWLIAIGISEVIDAVLLHRRARQIRDSLSDATESVNS